MIEPAPAGPSPLPRRGRPRNATPTADYLARKEQVLRTAAEVFASKGYETATLDDVAIALDMRKASLYHYVTSKSNLVGLLFVRAFQAGMQRLEEAARAVDARQRLIAIIRVFVDEMADHPGLIAAFNGHRPVFHDERDEQFKANDDRLMDIVTQAVTAATAANALPEVNPRYAALAIIGMVSCVHVWYDPAHDLAADQVAANMLRLLRLDGDVEVLNATAASPLAVEEHAGIAADVAPLARREERGR
ncbi:MAG: TetR/AcrR family transcriptional regulator [Chloroflexota bacterium]